jgi:hypothetical protein
VSEPNVSAELVEEAADPAIGQERIRVRFTDGHTEELRLHDYERLYALPGVYEQIVHDRLGCRSPAVMAQLLAEAVDEIGALRSETRVIDVAAGNGVSGEALAAAGFRLVLGTDIVAAARAAALRDRPGLYEDYETLDLVAVSADQRARLHGLGATALSCVGVVGVRAGQLPPEALVAAAAALTPDGLVAYMHDPSDGADVVTVELWRALVGDGGEAQELRRRRYLHRYTAHGARFELEGVVWRLRRGEGLGPREAAQAPGEPQAQ